MKFFAQLNDLGKPTAFYNDDIHAEIPEDAVEISVDDWQSCISEQGRYKFVDGKLIDRDQQEIDDDAVSVPMEPSVIDELIAENAELWYESMLQSAKFEANETEISALWYEVMMGGM
ncbi:hypothetical protein [Paenibacillus sp. FSL K6-2524]|uniref:hypothetical protein n=1 Tax=Paenibacillus sp. FSL K6-2524 TaxID=2954516 RepID=UPI0030FA1644